MDNSQEIVELLREIKHELGLIRDDLPDLSDIEITLDAILVELRNP
jgi:hypothetical protein